jgi:hypothetical protein
MLCSQLYIVQVCTPYVVRSVISDMTMTHNENKSDPITLYGVCI